MNLSQNKVQKISQKSLPVLKISENKNKSSNIAKCNLNVSVPVLKISNTKSKKCTNIYSPSVAIPKRNITAVLPNCWITHNTGQALINPKLYSKVILKANSSEYIQVSKQFNKTCSHMSIIKIEKIENPYLYLMYELKKLECKNLYPNLREIYLFHGTTTANLDSILTHNLNWRMSGKNVGCKYGKGVAFSESAKYALSYSDTNDAPKIILASVLYAKSCQGLDGINLPRQGCDTSKGNKGMVWVKFNDHEFYPAYVISVQTTQ
jgi:hypothetical protein